jgi:PIN domain nuclease of toxin-antitoxin system
VRLLLDTQVVVWVSLTPDRLSEAAHNAISSAEAVFVSAVAAWEIAIKSGLGQLNYPLGLFERQIADMGFEPLMIRMDHALAAGALPLHHRDPFDRMLVAQAQIEQLNLVTSDRKLAQYDVPILRA